MQSEAQHRADATKEVRSRKQTSCERQQEGKTQQVSSLILCAVASVFGSLYLNLFIAYSRGGEEWLSSAVSIGGLLRLVLFTAVFFALAVGLIRTRKPLHFIFKWRYLLVLLILAVSVIFQLSGSSIGLLAQYFSDLSDGLYDSGVIFGMNRSIRSDEWAVLTPFFLSQDAAGYPFVSDIIRGTQTVTGLVYAAPSWHLATLFHPFLAGFLVLGPGMGLSFFWVGRFLALFMSTFEFGRLITRDNRCLSATLAILVSLSPLVQWWFAVNGLVEMIIFGQLLVILLERFLRCNTVLAKFALAFGMAWAAGCFLLCLYPALQVPFFYVFAGMGIWIGIRHCKKMRRAREVVVPVVSRDATTSPELTTDQGIPQGTSQDNPATFSLKKKARGVVPLPYSIVALAIALLALVACMAFIFWDGQELVSLTLNTVYPGKRFETGGGWFRYLFDGTLAFSLPFDMNYSLRGNVCEAAAFISLFPLGSVLGVVIACARRDPLSIILLVVQAFFVIFAVLGIPPFLAQVSLMSNVPIFRIVAVITYLDVILLVRALALRSLSFSTKQHAYGRAYVRTVLPQWAIALVALACLAVAIVVPVALGELLPSAGRLGFLINVCGALIMGISILFALLYPLSRRMLISLLVCVACTVGVAGLCVNPLRLGISEMQENESIQQIAQVVDEDPDALWIGENSLHGQGLIIAGAKAINSVNIYPDLERWSAIDPNDEYQDVYNRYAHIGIVLQSDEPTQFELFSSDTFIVHLNVDDLKDLDVAYVLTKEDLSMLSTDTTDFEAVEETDAGTIYRVSYR